MPLTDELGEACRELLPQNARIPAEFTGGHFESWLSQLAEDQPYLNTQENLSSQALFHSFSAAIAEVLERRTQAVLREGWPHWLPVLIRALHFTRSTAVTFNYDTIIECAVANEILFEWGLHQHVPWPELSGDIPSWPPGDIRWGSEPYETLRLLKLHGSLNWYWSAGDTTGASVARRDLPGRFGAGVPYTEEDRRRHLPGRVPFIVPPASSKSIYYRNPISKEMWQQAALGLSLADDVVLMGYSIPLTDLTVSAMLRSAVVPYKSRITVVDLQPYDVGQRLQSLGIGEDRLTLIGPSEHRTPIELYTRNWIGELGSAASSDASTNGASDAPMAVVWGREKMATVTSYQRDDDTTTLQIGHVGLPGMLGREPGMAGELVDSLPILGDVVGSDRLLVRRPDGSTDTVISFGHASFETGHPEWNILYTSGAAPFAG